MKAGPAIASGKRGTTVLKKFRESLFDGMGRAFRVVGCAIEDTTPKHDICTLASVLRRYRKGHVVKVSKKIERDRILAFPRCENAHFGPERANQLKTPRFDSRPGANRPSRFV